MSTRADLVTGGDVLLRIQVPHVPAPGQFSVTVGGRDATGLFRQAGNGFVGLVDGLALGATTVVARIGGTGGERLSTSLTVVNHPISGPVLSGPHQTPFVCETAAFRVPIVGISLGTPLDGDCTAPTRVDYVYKTTTGAFKPLPDPRTRPADLARTTTSDGRAVNYLVRVETGTINRAIYETAVLHDPVTDPAPTPQARPAGWNERLIYSYSGGCRAGYRQGGGVETFPPPVGQLSAMPSPIKQQLAVTGLRRRRLQPQRLQQQLQRRHLRRDHHDGHRTVRRTVRPTPPHHRLRRVRRRHATTPDRTELPRPPRRHPAQPQLPRHPRPTHIHIRLRTTQPRVRHHVDHHTEDRRHGLGLRRTLHNPLQRRLGPRLPRHHQHRTHLQRMQHRHPTQPPLHRDQHHRRPLHLPRQRRQHLRPRPHHRLRPTTTGQHRRAVRPRRVQHRHHHPRPIPEPQQPRRRLRLPHLPRPHPRPARQRAQPQHPRPPHRRHGNADNHITLLTTPTGTGAANPPAVATEALRLMDQWLTAITADPSNTPPATKVTNNKPAGATDTCYTAAGTRVTDQTQCRQLYPPHENPRLAAGEPLANDILKCALTPVQPTSYHQPLTTTQLQRLQAPTGSWLRY